MKLTHLKLSILQTGESYHWYAPAESIPESAMRKVIGPDKQAGLIMAHDYTLSRTDIPMTVDTIDYQIPWKGEPLTGRFLEYWPFNPDTLEPEEWLIDQKNPPEIVMLNQLGYLRIFRAQIGIPNPYREEQDLEAWISQIMPWLR